MFRRQTDQVFSTLQAVQRRISKHTDEGAETPAPGASARPGAGTVPRSGGLGSHAPRPLGKPIVIRSTPTAEAGEHSPPPPVLGAKPVARSHSQVRETLKGAGPAPAPGQLVLPLQAVMTAGVLMLGAVIGAFFIGRATAPATVQVLATQNNHANGAETPPANGNAPQIQVQGEAPRASGRQIILLGNATDRTKAEANVQQWNDYARKYATSLPYLHPWFAIRSPGGGPLQVIYGEVAPGQIGIDASDEQHQKALEQIKKSFPNAAFIELERR
jgi:hypothetical protein